MSTHNRYGEIRRIVSAGLFRLLILAALLGMMVLGWVTQTSDAAEPEYAEKSSLLDKSGRLFKNSVITWSDEEEIKDTKNYDHDQTLLINNTANALIGEDGLILARGCVVLEGSGSILAAEPGSRLMVGSATAAGTTPTANGMFAQTLDRRGNSSRLVFENVIVNQGTGDFNLGAIKRTESDSFHTGGMYIGEDWLGKNEALNALTFTTTDNQKLNGASVSKVWINGDVVLANGGVITLAGHQYGRGGIAGQTIDLSGENPDSPVGGSFEHAFTMNGGTLNMTGPYGAELQMKDILISGGTVNLSAENPYLSEESSTPSWTNAPALIGASGDKNNTGSFRITGGTVNLGDYGTLRTFWTDSAHAGTMSITGGVINMNGGENSHAVIRAAADAKRPRNRSESTLTIGKDAVVNVAAGKYGAILARDTTFSSGVINVDGSLVIAGAADETQSSVANGIASDAVNKWGDFRFGGGTMNIGERNGAKGVVDFVSGNMTLTASGGGINGKLVIVDSGTAVNDSSTSGVYATNLTVTKSGSRFTVRDLCVNSTGTGNAVTIAGKMVVANDVSAASNVSKGSLLIDGGSLTANDRDFVTYSVDSETNDIQSFTVNSALAAALSGSTGSLNLNTTNSSVAYNMTSEQYADLKKALGLSGNLNLLGVVVSDMMEWKTDSDGNVDIEIINPSAQVVINAEDTDANVITFNETVSVKELAIKNGGKEVVVDGETVMEGGIDKVVLGKSSSFTGSGNIDSGIIKGGVHEAMDVDVHGVLSLGIAGNRDSQGGFLGDIAITGTDAGKAGLDVADGQFRVGSVSVDDADGGVNASVGMHIFRSGESGQYTTLQADRIDFTGLDEIHSATINVADATLSVKDGIALNGNSDGGLWLEDNALVTTKFITGASTVSVEDGSLLAVRDGIVLSGGKNATVNIAGGTLTAGRLDLGESGGLVLVGDQTRKGTLVVGEMALRGGLLFADPAWVAPGAPVEDISPAGVKSVASASSIMIEKFAGNTTDGNIIIGQNSHFTYGTLDSGWLPEQINHAGVWGQAGSYKVGAALGLYNPLVLGKGYSLTVNGDITAMEGTDSDGNAVVKPGLDGSLYAAGNNTANFGADSLLVVNAGKLTMNTAALTAESGDATLNVDAGAKLYIYNAQSGNEFKIVDGFDKISNTIGNTAWISSNNINDSEMTHVVLRPDGSAVMASVTARDANSVYAQSSEGVKNTVNNVYGFGSGNPAVNDVDSDNAGISYVSKATSKAYNGSNLGRHAATIEGTAQMAVVGGAPLHAFNIMRLTSDTIRKRFSFAAGHVPHPYGHTSTLSDAVNPADLDLELGSVERYAGRQEKKLVSIWATPLFQRNNVSEMDVGGFGNGFSTNMYGANLGFDFNLSDNVQFGILGSFGSGKAKSKDSILAYTENSIDFAGVSGYAAWSSCNVTLLADGGFQSLKNDITQDNWIEGGRSETDPKVRGWNVGVTAEFLAPTKYVDIVPYLSLRYEGVSTDKHQIRSSKGVLFEVDDVTQHVVTVPVGVSFSKDLAPTHSMRLTPYADVGALFAMGDKEHKSSVSIPTLRGEKFTTQIIDSAAFKGSVGMNGECGKIFGGINYNVMASSRQTSHGFWASFGVNF